MKETVDAVVFIMLLIPIAIYFIFKWLIKAIFYIAAIISALFSKNKSTHSVDLSEVDAMDGLSFEKFTASLLEQNGFEKVRVTKSSGDFGVDIIAKKNKSVWAFQCKCYSRNLGVKPIQEVYSGMMKYHANVPVVITNAYFTPHAQELADELGVALWDRNKLAELMGTTVIKKNHDEDEVELIDDTKASLITESLVKTDQRCLKEIKRITDNIEFTNDSIDKKEAEGLPMATVIGAGKYIFGEDIPMGKYDFEADSGNGMFEFQTDPEGDTQWISMGKEKGYAQTYNNLSLPKGWWFSVSGSLKLKVTRSQMLKIE